MFKIYNIDNIFKEGYVDAYTLKMFLEEIIEDTKNNQTEIEKILKPKTKRIYCSTNSIGSNFIENSNLKETIKETITVDNKNIICISFSDEDFFQNVKNIKCNIETFLVESNSIKNRIKLPITINSSLIRKVDDNKIYIPYSFISKMLENSNFFVINFNYETTTVQSNVDNEEFDNFEKIIFENSL